MNKLFIQCLISYLGTVYFFCTLGIFSILSESMGYSIFNLNDFIENTFYNFEIFPLVGILLSVVWQPIFKLLKLM